ncbi:MAG: Mini-ribonuclease 3 [Oculatellaceae cyanobacterium Prado106]|nr:Mini-ribonuclease 3 [Oculatellaceae cyanobacterium Prado106]
MEPSHELTRDLENDLEKAGVPPKLPPEVSTAELFTQCLSRLSVSFQSFQQDPTRPQAARLQQISPAAMAYLGDAVYELYIRTYYLTPPKRIQDYHEEVVAQVRAERQADHLRSLHPHLTPPELDILKRGRNAAPKGPKRLNPKIYQQATSLETLLGYLYITDTPRLVHLLSQLDFETEVPSSDEIF